MTDLTPHKFIKHLVSYIQDDSAIACHYKREFGRPVAVSRIAEIRRYNKPEIREIEPLASNDRAEREAALQSNEKFLAAMGIIHGKPPSKQIQVRLATERANIRAVVEAEKAIQKVIQLEGITREEFFKWRRSPEHIARIRFAIAYHLSSLGISYPKIARAIGRSDHTTAIHAVLRAHELLEEDAKFVELVGALRD